MNNNNNYHLRELIVSSIHTPSTASQQLHLLYQSHHPWLISWLRRRLHQREQVEDIAQDTFIQLLGRTHIIAELKQPKAWLSTVAHSLWVDRVRRDKVEQHYLQVLAEMPEAVAPSPEQRLLLLETLAHVDVLLQGLPNKARLAFLMSRLEGLAYKDIAAKLGVSLSSVEKYMATAIKHCFILQMSWQAHD